MTIDNELALKFLRKAEHDLGSARLLLTGENLFDSVCFHCQQLAEKSMKAVLTHRSIRFKKVHDLDMLLSLLDDPDFNSIWNYALILNSYAVDARYPALPTPHNIRCTSPYPCKIFGIAKNRSCTDKPAITSKQASKPRSDVN